MPPAGIGDGIRCEVQVRAHGDPVPAAAVLRDGELVVRPDAPLDGVAPGQSAVLYAGTRVLGQATIERTASAVPLTTAAG
jgi:tRNA-specific 2-thiouridylase